MFLPCNRFVFASAILSIPMGFLATSSASAALLQIQLGGVDIEFNGSDIFDNDPLSSATVDSLTNATFILNDSLVGTVTSGVTLDLLIPSIPPLNAMLTTTVLSGLGGTLDLELGGGDYLSLDLGKASVTYVPISSTIKFAFAGVAADIAGQKLPFGLTISDPVQVSFSTQVSSSSSVAGKVSRFIAAGTGEIAGIEPNEVPEPASIALLGLGGLAILTRRRNA